VFTAITLEETNGGNQADSRPYGSACPVEIGVPPNCPTGQAQLKNAWDACSKSGDFARFRDLLIPRRVFASCEDAVIASAEKRCSYRPQRLSLDWIVWLHTPGSSLGVWLPYPGECGLDARAMDFLQRPYTRAIHAIRHGHDARSYIQLLETTVAHILKG
jgi:hypothetical protein